MCTPNFRTRLAAANPGAISTNATDIAAPPSRSLGVTLAAFPAATTRPAQPPGFTNARPAATNDVAAQQRLPPPAQGVPSRAAPSDRAPTPSAAQDRLDAIMRQIQADQTRQGATGPTIKSADAARPLPSPPATTSPSGNAPLDAIMQKIRPEPSSARNIADASRGPRPSPSQAPAATAQKRQVAGAPGSMPNAAPNASTAPAPQRQWPVHGYDRTPDGTTSRAGQRGPNRRRFSGDGRFDPTGAKGLRHGRRHTGLDLPAQLGDPVRAAADGVVVKVEPQIEPLHYWTKDKKGHPLHAFLMQPKRDKAGNPVYDKNGRAVVEHVIGLVGYGNRVWIDHPDGTQTTYNHLQSRSPLALGTKVKSGQTIGSVGSGSV
jgi:murein DD-endopeptidase MepM/ murein hydrolase activator NlpD